MSSTTESGPAFPTHRRKAHRHNRNRTVNRRLGPLEGAELGAQIARQLVAERTGVRVQASQADDIVRVNIGRLGDLAWCHQRDGREIRVALRGEGYVCAEHGRMPDAMCDHTKAVVRHLAELARKRAVRASKFNPEIGEAA